MSELPPIPSDWKSAVLGDIFDVQQGKAMSASARTGSNQRPFLRTANVAWGKLDLTTVDQMHFDDDEVVRLSLQNGDLLVCEGGDVGRTAVWNNNLPGCLYQNHIHRLRRKTSEISPEFAMFWLQEAFTHLGIFDGEANKTTIPNLSSGRLKNLPIPQPPATEQRTIASILSKLHAAAETRNKLVRRLNDLKFATMMKIFREGLQGGPSQESEIGRVPADWQIVHLGKILKQISYGTSVRCVVEKVGPPVLRIPNVINGQIDTTKLKYGKFTAKELERSGLQEGDMLFVRTNGNREYMGRCAVFHGVPKHALFASYLLRVRLNTDIIHPDFLHAFMMATGKVQIVSKARPSADGKYNINTGTLEEVLVPLPPLDQQLKIVEIDQALSNRIIIAEASCRAMESLFSSTLQALMLGQVRV